MVVATGTTGTDGQFTITTTLPSGGYVRAAFTGDTGLLPSYSSPGFGLLLNAVNLPSRLVLNPIPKSVSAGTMVEFTGTLSTTSKTVASIITDRTHFASVNIQRSSSGSSISGQVSDLFRGVSFSSLRGLKLRLYYRPTGSKAWHAYRRATVGRAGFFGFSVAESYGFRFKVVLPKQSPFESSASRIL